MTHLFITAEAVAGSDIRDDVLPQMVRLARTTDCAVEVRGNGTRFVAYPADSIGGMQAAFDRLYPASTYVSVSTVNPMPRTTAQAVSTRYAARFEGPAHVGQWRVRDLKWDRWAVPRLRFRTLREAQDTADAMNAREGATA